MVPISVALSSCGMANSGSSSLARQAPLVLLAQPVLQERQVHQVHKGLQAQPALQVHQEHQVQTV